MIYSNSKNFLFCHVPKTGGTSLRSKLKHYSRASEQSYINKLIRRFPYAENSALFYDFYNRPHTTCCKAQILLGSKYNKVLSFAIIRDPFDWVISSYAHFARNYKYISIDSSSFCVNSFEEYVDLMSRVDYCKLPCQHKLVVDKQGYLIVNMLGEFDKVDQFSCFVQKLLKLDRYELPHLNKNPRHKLSSVQISDITKNKIKNIWRFDFRLWDIFQEHKKNFFCFPGRHSISTSDLNLEAYDPWGVFIN